MQWVALILPPIGEGGKKGGREGGGERESGREGGLEVESELYQGRAR